MSIVFASGPACWAEAPGTAIVFYAQPKVAEDLWPAFFETLRADLAADSDELPKGVELDRSPALLRGRDLLTGIRSSDVLVVKLLGRCDVLPQLPNKASSGPLGWVLLVSGQIQPFISIDCARLAQVLGPEVLRMNKEQRRHAMTQAMAHVLIHEWIHVATQSAQHSSHGIMQESFSATQLIAGPKANADAAMTVDTRRECRDYAPKGTDPDSVPIPAGVATDGFQSETRSR